MARFIYRAVSLHLLRFTKPSEVKSLFPSSANTMGDSNTPGYGMRGGVIPFMNFRRF